MIQAKVTLRFKDGREEVHSMGFEPMPVYDAEYESRGTSFYVHSMKYTLDFPGGWEVILQEAGSIPKEATLNP